MAKESLQVPEENLADVIAVIRSGLGSVASDIAQETREQLLKWCDEEERYLIEVVTLRSRICCSRLIEIAREALERERTMNDFCASYEIDGQVSVRAEDEIRSARDTANKRVDELLKELEEL